MALPLVRNRGEQYPKDSGKPGAIFSNEARHRSTVRKLYLVPVIHMSADMGSLAAALDERATAELGQELWHKHKGVVSGFWESIAQFFALLNVGGFKVYQDGLVADGDDGLRIVNQGVKEGSRNYEIVSRLLRRGATLVRTEDISLVKKEYDFIAKMAQAKSLRQRDVASLKYRLARGRLLEQRDSVVVARIDGTLKEGETGILFIGAYHHVLPKLAADIEVTQVKEVAKVREYYQLLTSPKRQGKHVERLAEYLMAPVRSPLS